MEKLPQVPATLFSNLDTFEKLSKLAPQIQQAADDYQQAKQSQGRRTKLTYIAILLGVATVVSSSPQTLTHLSNLPLLPIGLGLAAITCWLLR
jgi:hypothetical protein